MRYFDSHAHYYDERFAEELGRDVDEFIDSLLSSSVSYIVNIGTSPTTSKQAIEQAKKHTEMYTTVGIHPSDTRFLSSVEENLAEIEELILNPESRAVALGEIGLDYHYPDTDKTKQMEYFLAQMEMAKRLSVSVVIHDREAHEDIMNVLRRYPEVTGILHSYSGSVEMAKELIKMGYYISFSGTLTFTNARKPKEVAEVVPHERVLIETDAPYLAPHPMRGTLNHSGNLVYTNRILSEIWGITEEECARITEENAKRIYNIK